MIAILGLSVARATVLTFESPAGVASSQPGVLNPAYGQRVTGPVSDGFTYGEAGGWTPDVAVEFGTRRGTVADWSTSARFGIGIHQGTVNGSAQATVLRALMADGAEDQTLEIMLLGRDGAWPTLAGFDLVATGGRTPTLPAVIVTDDRLTTLHRTNQVVLPGANRLPFRFDPPLTGPQLRVVISLGRLQEVIGLDNFEFGQRTAVPAGWVFDTVRALGAPLGPNCPDGAGILNLALDGLQRPTLGWFEANGCGGYGTGWWARRDASGGWSTQRLSTANDQIYTDASALAFNASGVPFFFNHQMFCCDGLIYTTRANLDANPQGPGSAFLFQGRNYTARLSADGRAGDVPGLVSYLSSGGGPILLNGNPITAPIRALSGGLVYRQGPAGQPHVAYISEDTQVHYNTGSIGSDRKLLPSDFYNRALSMAIDASNGVHIVAARGTGSGAFEAAGRLTYLYSADGVTWTNEDLGVDVVGAASVALDSRQRPAIAALTRFDSLYFTRRTTDGWTRPERLRQRLRLDGLGSMRSLALTIDPADSAYLAFHDASARRLLVAREVPQLQPGDLQVRAEVSTNALSVAGTAVFTVRITNAGPREMRGVRLFQSFPPEMLVRAVEPPALLAEANRYTIRLPDLGAGEETTVRFRLSALDPVRNHAVSRVTSHTAEAAPADNEWLATTPVFSRSGCDVAQDCDLPALSLKALPSAWVGKPWSVLLRSANLPPGTRLTLDTAGLPADSCLTDSGELRLVPSSAGTLPIRLSWTDGVRTQVFTRDLEVRSDPRPPGLLAHWPLEGTGREAVAGQTGFKNPSATFVPGAFGLGLQAAHQPGAAPELLSTDAVTFPPPSGSMTVAGWFRRDVQTDSVGGSVPAGTWITWMGTDPFRDVHLVQQPANGRLAIYQGPADARAWMREGNLVPTSQWVHVAVVFEGRHTRVWVDGLLQIDVNLPADRQAIRRWIVGGTGNGRYFTGAVDELCVFDRALETSELEALRLRGLPYIDPVAEASGGFGVALGAGAPSSVEIHEGERVDIPLAGHFCGQPDNFRMLAGSLPEALTLDSHGHVSGVALRSGEFPIQIEANNGRGPATATFLLRVTPVVPRFFVQPLAQTVLFGETVRLFVVATPNSTLQWRHQGTPIPGATQPSLVLEHFSAGQAGDYDCVASNAGGATASASATLTLVQPAADARAPSIDSTGVGPGGTFQLRFGTVPGRVYQVRRAAGDHLDPAGTTWEVLLRFTASSLQAAYEDSAYLRTDQRYYQVIEEPPQPASPFTPSDTTRWIPLDASGTPRPGFAVATDSSGEAAPFEFRPAGSLLPEGFGLRVRFPSGATATNVAGATVIRFQHAEFELGPESPLQFPRPLVVRSGSWEELPSGPIDVRRLEQWSGDAPGDGVEVVAYQRFPFRLVAGVFDGNSVRGARLRYLKRSGVPEIPLPPVSGDYPAFDLPLDGRGPLRIAFHGSIELPDAIGRPARLSIPTQRPLWLELHADGHVRLRGRAELDFQDGPRFAAALELEDPRFHLRLEAARLRLPPALPAGVLLPAPSAGDSAEDSALDLAAGALDQAWRANRTFASWLAAENGETNSPTAPFPAADGIESSLEFWQAVSGSWALSALPPEWFAAVKRLGQNAAASHDPSSVLETIRLLKAVLRDRPGASIREIEDAIAEARAAARRCLDVAPADVAPERAKEIARLGVAAAARIQAGGADDSELQAALRSYLMRFGQDYLVRRLGITAGVYTAPPQSPLRAQGRHEASLTLAVLLDLERCAQQLGFDTQWHTLPHAEAILQVADRIWRDLSLQLNAALARQDRRTFLYLLPEMAELVRLEQSGIYPDPDHRLPTTAMLASYLDQTVQGLPLEQGADEVYGQRPEQVRDDAERFAALLRNLPAGLAMPTEAIARNYRQLGERLSRLQHLVGATTLFPIPELKARIEALLVHEELRLRFNLGPDAASLQTQLEATTDRLVEQAVATGDAGALIEAARACLTLAGRFDVADPASRAAGLHSPRPADASNADPASRARGRLAQLRNASRLVNALKTINVQRWDRLQSTRPTQASQLAADLWLPAGITVEEAAGEVEYDVHARRLRGAFRGQLALPNVEGRLEVLNASIESGGVLDLSLAGNLDLPGGGSAGRLTVTRRHPWHLAVDANRHVTLEGGARVRLGNGASFEGFISMSDPLYRIGASASGLRLELASHLAVTIPVPSPQGLADVTDSLGVTLNDYLGHLGATLEPLTTLTNFPALPDPGTPPDFAGEMVTLDTSSLRASVAALAALSNSPVRFGFATLNDATSAIQGIVSNANRQLGRSAAELAHVRAAYERTSEAAQRSLRAPARRQLAEAYCLQVDSLLEFIEELSHYIEAQNRGLLGGRSLRFSEQPLLLRNFEETRVALLALLADSDLADDPALTAQVAECALKVEHAALLIGFNFEGAIRATIVTAAIDVRTRLLRRIGLAPDGAVADRVRLESAPEFEWISIASQLLHWVDLEQRLGGDGASMAEPLLQIHLARRQSIVRRIRSLQSDAGTREVLRDARTIDEVVPRLLDLVRTADLGLRGGRELELEQVDGSRRVNSVSGDLVELLAVATTVQGRLATRLATPDGADAALYRQYELARQKKAQAYRALQQAFERRARDTRTASALRQLEAASARVARAQFRALDTAISDPAFQVTMANALGYLDEVVSLTRLLETSRLPDFSETSVNAELVGRSLAALLPKVRLQVTTLARARQAWWLAHRSTALLQESWRAKAEADWTALDRALRDGARESLATTAELVTALRQASLTESRTLDFHLPGDLVIREVAGQLTLNTAVPSLDGVFSGTLEFPDAGGARFSLDSLRLASDGSFALEARAEAPVGIGGSARFSGTLTATGRKHLSRDFDGTIDLTGRGQLFLGDGPSLGATLRYAQVVEDNRLQWRLALDVQAAGIQRLGEDAVLFEANAGATGGNAGPGVALRLGGKAAFWRKDRSQPLPTDDALVTPDLFQVVVDDVQFVLEDSPQFSRLTVQQGTLRLPPAFYPVELPAELRCAPRPGATAGPALSIDAAHPLAVTLPRVDGRLVAPQLSGGIVFSRFGFQVPGLPDLAATLCDAELQFEPTGPSFLVRDGRLTVPFPTDNLVLRLSDARFTLNGLPVGRLSLVEPFTVFDAGGVQLTFLGAPGGSVPARRFQFPADYTAAEREACQGTAIEIFALPAPNERSRGIRFIGSVELSVPPSMVLAEGSQGGRESGAAPDADEPSVGATVCGTVTIVPGNPRPQVSVDLNKLGLATSPGVAWRLGPSGIRILDPAVSIENPASLFMFDPANPARLRLAGTMDVAGQFQLALRNARFEFDAPGRLPRFMVDGMGYQQGANSHLGRLPVQLTAAQVQFKNPALPLPELLNASNVELTISALVQLPPPDPTANPPVTPVLVGAVERVAVSYNRQTGWPEAPSLDAVELGLVTDAIKLPPLEAVGGRARLGGLQGASLDDIYIAARLTAKLQTTLVGLTGVFVWQGPLGLCFDLNAGPVGIPIGPTGFLFTGASGGFSFINGNGDPCSFSSYFERAPHGFLRLKATGLPTAPMSWAELRDTAARMAQLAQANAPNLPSPHAVPTTARAQSRPHAPDDPVHCPGDCPPKTINLFCQPHPDTNAFPDRVILKFSSIDEPTLNEVLQIRPDTFQPNAGAPAIAAAVAQKAVSRVRTLTPLPDVPGFEALADGLEAVLAQAVNRLAATLQRTLESPGAMATSASIYERIRLEAYKGIGCPDLTVTIAGRLSYTGLSSFAYVEGKGIASTAGSLGMIGTVNVLGLPLGEGRLFVSATDNQGLPNPSACGEIKASIGPLELGLARAALECPGCVTALGAAVPELLQILGEPVARQMLARIAPGLGQGTRRFPELLAALAALDPAERFGIATRLFDALQTLGPEDIPADLVSRLVAALGRRVDDIQPVLSLCGQVQPRIFGLALGRDPLVDLRARINRQGYAGSVGFSVAAAAYPFAAVLPATDYATLSFNYPVPDPVELLFAGLQGGFASPELATALLRDHLDAALNRTSFAVSYDLHPFGFQMASAAGRFIEPELFAHPAAAGSRWVTPESRGLPSRLRVLVEAARQHRLGDAVSWAGIGDEFPGLFPEDSAERAVLLDLGRTLNRPLSLRQDYFPHGGFVGAGVLTFPMLLAESPAEWSPLLRQLAEDSDPLRKLQAAGSLIQDHLLASTNTGQIAFYVPAPNPPRLLTHPADSLERLRILRQMNTAAHLGSELAALSADELRALMPLDLAFLRGELGTEGFNQRLLGIPFGSAEVEATRDTAFIRLAPPARSWLAQMLADVGAASPKLELTLDRMPTNRLEDSFQSLRTRLATLPAAEILPEWRREFGRSLPRIHFVHTVAPPPLPNALAQLLSLDGELQFEGFGPGYAPDTAGNTPAAQARRDGGLVLRGRFNAALQSPASDARIELLRLPETEFILTPSPTDPLAPPRVAAEIRQVAANVLGLLPIPAATVRIDTAAPHPFELEATLGTVDFGLFQLRPATGSTNSRVILTAFALTNSSGGSGARMELDPMSLALPGASSSRSVLALHGTGGITERFALTTHGPWSASASLGSTQTLRLWSGTNEILRLVPPSAARFACDGLGLGQWNVSGDLPSPDQWTMTVLPAVRLGNANGLVLAASGSANAHFSLASDGTFNVTASLRSSPLLPGLPAFVGTVEAEIDNAGLTLRGTLAGGSQGEVRLLPDGRVVSTTELVLGPFDFRLPNGHRLARLASATDGAITAHVANGASVANLSGAVLTVWLDADGSSRQFSLPDVAYDTTLGTFSTDASGTLSMAGGGRLAAAGRRPAPQSLTGTARVGAYVLGRLERVNFARTAADRFELQVDGLLDLPGLPALDARLRIGPGQFSFSLPVSPGAVSISGISFADVELSAPGQEFHPANLAPLVLAGRLDTLPVPLRGLRLRGPIFPDGSSRLDGGHLLDSLVGAFPTRGVQVSLGGRSPSADYAAAIAAQGPAGWWRFQGTTATDSSGYTPGYPANGVRIGNPAASQPGAFDAPANRAFRFDGVDDRIDVPLEYVFENFPHGIAVEAWFQRESTAGTARRTLVSKGDSWKLALNESTRRLEWSVRLAGSGPVALASTFTVNDTAWHHVVAGHDGTVLRLWLDGRPAGTVSASAPLEPNDIPVRIAASLGDGSLPWRGGLDEVAIYPKPLLDGDVAEHVLAATAPVSWSTDLRLAGWPNTTLRGFVAANGSLALRHSNGASRPLGEFPLVAPRLLLSRMDNAAPVLDIEARLGLFGHRVVGPVTLPVLDREWERVTGRLSGDGTLAFRAVGGDAMLAGYPLVIRSLSANQPLALDRIGSGGPGLQSALQLAIDGRFTFPAGLGSADFQGFTTAAGIFTLVPSGDVQLQVNGNPVTLNALQRSQFKLTQDRLKGNVQLGLWGVNQTASITFERQGGAAGFECLVTGDTGWKTPPIVHWPWGRLFWSGRFTLQDGQVRSAFSATAAAAAYGPPERLDDLPEGLATYPSGAPKSYRGRVNLQVDANGKTWPDVPGFGVIEFSLKP